MFLLLAFLLRINHGHEGLHLFSLLYFLSDRSKSHAPTASGGHPCTGNFLLCFFFYILFYICLKYIQERIITLIYLHAMTFTHTCTHSASSHHHSTLHPTIALIASNTASATTLGSLIALNMRLVNKIIMPNYYQC